LGTPSAYIYIEADTGRYVGDIVKQTCIAWKQQCKVHHMGYTSHWLRHAPSITGHNLLVMLQ